MTNHVLRDPKTGMIIASEFDKVFKSEDYEVFFNSKTGLEVSRGTNGKPDPFMTQLPLLLDIGVMGSCQNNCEFCYQGDGDEPDMTLENFKLIIDQTKHHVNQVALGGRGDPNKHEQFEEIVKYARKNNVIPSYTTSAINLTNREIEISKMCGAVAVSDYGNKTTYDGIQRFIDSGIKTNIHLIFSNYSYEKCVRILYGHNPWISSISKAGLPLFDIEKLNAVIFLLFKPQGRGTMCPELIPNEYQLGVIGEKILKPNTKFKVGLDSCLANHLYRLGYVKDIDDLTMDSCEGGRMSAYITPDMRMMPCSYANKEKAIPITKKKDISYIWNRSMPFRSFRSILKKKSFSCPAGF